MEHRYKLRPHHGLCISFFSVKKYSEKYKKHIKKIIAEFKQDIHDNILSCRKCETICGDCEWSEICYINGRKNKKLICWINEQDKILSFHQEEGFVQKEFTDRDELRCFLLAVYGIYRIQ